VSVTPARRAALEVIATTREREGWSHDVLNSVLRRRDLSSRDAALATRLAYGTLQTVGILDEAIDRHVPRPSGVHPRVRDALRLSAYELLFGGGSAYSAVSECVEAVKSFAPHAASFANAVMRRIAEDAASFPWGDPATDDSALARATGHPLWLVRALLNQYPREVVSEVLRANNEPAPLYVAHNPFAGSHTALLKSLQADGAEPVETPVPGCVVCANAPAAVGGESLRSGLCVVADAAAQLVPRFAAVERPGTVVDIGAGRGTKTLLIQAACDGRARVLAVDVHEFKLHVLRERMETLGVPGVDTLNADATDPESLLAALGGPSADAVFVDAPCSGLGTLRRAPEKRWRLSPDDPARLAGLAARLLSSAGTLVRAGGVVVYSTCTVLAQENGDVVRGFLAGERGAGFGVRDVRDLIPDAWSAFRTHDGFFQSLPAVGGPDGHFAAVLTKATVE